MGTAILIQEENFDCLGGWGQGRQSSMGAEGWAQVSCCKVFVTKGEGC